MQCIVQVNDLWLIRLEESYHNREINIEIDDERLACQAQNRTRIILNNPRINIDLIYSVFDFFFENWPIDQQQESTGRVLFPVQVIHNMDTNMTDMMIDDNTHELGTLIIRNAHVVRIIIPIPSFPQSVCREICASHAIRTRSIQSHEECPICLTSPGVLVRFHDNEEKWAHLFCATCIMAIDSLVCPICRRRPSYS